MMFIGARLETLRKDRGFRQVFVSEHTGIRQDELSRFESGARVPTLRHLKSLARFYQMSVVQLLGGDDAGLSVDELELLTAYRRRDYPCMIRVMASALDPASIHTNHQFASAAPREDA